MILKRPVISTAVGGIPELIVDGETGLLVPVEDENALAQELEKVMSDKDFAQTLAENGCRHMYENFSTGRQVALVRETFRFAMAKKQRQKQ